ncbi:MAG: hypothetical protein AAGN35_28125 [Bacteroidota bacterium]
MATSKSSSSKPSTSPPVYATLPSPPPLQVPAEDNQATAQTKDYIRQLVNRYEKVQSQWQVQDVIYNTAIAEEKEAQEAVNETAKILQNLQAFYNSILSAETSMKELQSFFQTTTPLVNQAKTSIGKTAEDMYTSFKDMKEASLAVEYCQAIIKNYNAYLSGESQTDPQQNTNYPSDTVITPIDSVTGKAELALKNSETSIDDTLLALSRITRLDIISKYLGNELTTAIKMLNRMKATTRSQLVVAQKSNQSARAALELATGRANSATELLESYYNLLLMLKAEIEAAQQAAAGVSLQQTTTG